MRDTGQLALAAGKIVSLSMEADGFALCRWRARGRSNRYVYRAAAVINCSGPTGDVLVSNDPLIKALVRRGFARPDPLRLGFDVDDQGRLRDASGVPSPTLLVVGPASRGSAWETTAVPDIRGQAASAARLVVEALGRSGA